MSQYDQSGQKVFQQINADKVIYRADDEDSNIGLTADAHGYLSTKKSIGSETLSIMTYKREFKRFDIVRGGQYRRHYDVSFKLRNEHTLSLEVVSERNFKEMLLFQTYYDILLTVDGETKEKIIRQPAITLNLYKEEFPLKDEVLSLSVLKGGNFFFNYQVFIDKYLLV